MEIKETCCLRIGSNWIAQIEFLQYIKALPFPRDLHLMMSVPLDYYFSWMRDDEWFRTAVKAAIEEGS
jgi:hypothetical protein